jgi:hypothetical protein
MNLALPHLFLTLSPNYIVLALHCSGPSGGRIVAGGRPTRTGQEVGAVIYSQATKGDQAADMFIPSAKRTVIIVAA